MNRHLRELADLVDAAIAAQPAPRATYAYVPSARERFRISSCEAKRRYPDKRAAVSQINLLRARGRGNTRHLRAYPCAFCRHWHIAKAED